MLEQRMSGVEPCVPRVRYFTKPPLIRKRLYEDSDEEITQPSPEKCLPQEDKLWLDLVLHSQMQMANKIISPWKKNLGKIYNQRETAEISLYKAYLYKQFHCVAKCDEDDDIENVTFSGIDFSKTLQTVVSFFIQPPVYEGQFIVMAPNVTTLGAMDVIEITEDRLQSMSKYVSHSKNYLDYLCERRKNSPKCLQCLYTEQQITAPTRNVDDVIQSMKKDLFVVDDTLREAINVESSVLTTSNGTCCCAQLEESRKSVQLLRQRFMALFLWPALLSATDLSKEQNDILCVKKQRPDTHKNYFWQVNRKPAVTKTMLKKKKAENRKKGRTPRKVSDKDSLNVPMGDRKKPKPSTSRTTYLNDIAAGLRRSKRQCVLNRYSFAYPDTDHEDAMSSDALEGQSNCVK